MRSYPIVEQRALRPSSLFGTLFGQVRRAFRRAGDGQEGLPIPLGHETLVFVIGGGHHRVDAAGRTPSRATSVSVVDLRRNAQITVRMWLPSPGGEHLLAEVRFACTVLDPVTVVRDGVADVAVLLLGHLEGAQPGVSSEADVRAFLALFPVEIPGMAVELLGIELEPAERDEARWSNHALDYEARRRAWREAADLAGQVAGDPLTALLAGHLEGQVAASDIVGYLRE
ncbi:hypothetical protein ACIBG8_32685 [Nonomuraea sp. NPDC050556]|uniref:hypothetical protein n=1 Tax=Nonomuraea sp. NPDC050556 TaxID=3364369 RepID=UPI00378A7339